jgi:hypothetical protein
MSDLRVTKIRVPSRYTIDGTGERIAVAEFKLGVGPCGLNVVDLAVTFSDVALCVSQDHADGSCAEFLYLLSDLTGRVEVTYA